MSLLIVTVQLDPEDRKALGRAAGPATELVYADDLERSMDELLPRVGVILCAGLRQFTPSMIDRMGSLRMVQTLLAGADHLPSELFRPEVAVCTVSGAVAQEVAEHAIALLASAAKNVVTHTLAVREGKFDRSPTNLSLRGRVLGILGFGNVGRAVGDIGRALGMSIFAINRTGRTEERVDFIGTAKDLHRLLRKADFLVICLPLTKSTEGLIGKEELEAMKRDAVLVNVGRARVVQEGALFEHLKANPAFRAAFDVWWTYPKGLEGRLFSLPFHELENFVMTPHVADRVPGHRKKMMGLAIKNIGNFFMGKPLLNRVKEEDFPPRSYTE